MASGDIDNGAAPIQIRSQETDEVGSTSGGHYKFGVRSSGIHAMSMRNKKSKMDKDTKGHKSAEIEDSADETQSEFSNATKTSSQSSKSKKVGLQTRLLVQLTKLVDRMMKKTRRHRHVNSRETTEELSDISSMSGSEVVQRFLDNEHMPHSHQIVPKQESNEFRPETKSAVHNGSPIFHKQTPVPNESTSFHKQSPVPKEGTSFREHDKETRPVRHNRPTVIMPDKYDGKSDWTDYISHFESCRVLNAWADDQAVQVLAASLRGPALRLLNEQKNTKWTYEEMKMELALRFSSAKQSEAYLLELRNRKRRQNESLRELGRNIRELTAQAYPNFDTDSIDRLAKIHFVDAIHNSEIRAGILHARAASLDEVIQAAITTETFLQTEAQRVGWKRTTYNRMVESNSPTPTDPLNVTKEILSAVEEAVERNMNRRVLQRPSHDQNTVVCFYCGKQGHLGENCRNKHVDSNPCFNGRHRIPDPETWRRREKSVDRWSPQRSMGRSNYE